jgi:hypothetical protein
MEDVDLSIHFSQPVGNVFRSLHVLLCTMRFEFDEDVCRISSTLERVGLVGVRKTAEYGHQRSAMPKQK